MEWWAGLQPGEPFGFLIYKLYTLKKSTPTINIHSKKHKLLQINGPTSLSKFDFSIYLFLNNWRQGNTIEAIWKKIKLNICYEVELKCATSKDRN